MIADRKFFSRVPGTSPVCAEKQQSPLDEMQETRDEQLFVPGFLHLDLILLFPDQGQIFNLYLTHFAAANGDLGAVQERYLTGRNALDI